MPLTNHVHFEKELNQVDRQQTVVAPNTPVLPAKVNKSRADDFRNKFRQNLNEARKAELRKDKLKEDGGEGSSAKKKKKLQKKSRLMDDYGEEEGDGNVRSDDDDIAQQDFSHESEESLG